MSSNSPHLDGDSAESYVCPHCGARYPQGETCQSRFDACMAKEFENPAIFGAVHHLTVPCYMLQHNRYSREGWVETRELLRRFVREGLAPAAALQQDRQKLDSGRRAWNFTRGAKLAEVDEVTWTFTLAQVRLDTPEHYCGDVRHWAEHLLADTDALATANS